jgi:hypothetical protein
MNKFIKLFTITIFLYNFVYVSNAHTATINAATCSKANVETAINAASNGDVVTVPSGTCNWSSDVSINKEITVQGAGAGCPDNCDDATLIQGQCFALNADNIRITGFTFDGSGNCLYLPNSSVVNFRIDHNKITGYGKAIDFYKRPHLRYGVVDNNLIEDCTGECIYVIGEGNNSWTRGGPGGGYDNGTIYFEDNVFTLPTKAGKNIMEGGEGARWVFRYNTINEPSSGSGWNALMAVHGHEYVARDGPHNAGTYSVEVYNNTFTSDNGDWTPGFNVRGGRGVIFNNNYVGSGWDDYGVQFYNYETCRNRSAGTCNVSAHAGFGTLGHDTSPSWTGTNPCLNINGGYPCPLMPNNFYIWDNTQAQGTFTVEVASGCAVTTQEDRDYWDDVGAGDTNFVSGTSRPGTCTVDDVYWETGNKQLYRCSATNTWTFVYQPYTYPHPLRTGGGGGGGGGDTMPPAAPPNPNAVVN